MSVFRKLFANPIVCTKCGHTDSWTIDASKNILLCVSTDDNEQLCMNELKPEEIFNAEQLLYFKRLIQIFRIFPSY